MMKKSLILALALVFVFAVAGTAFAAANPFVDVPANSWAYGAVADLAKAGIIDGYGDGTFRGDKLLTRYEMAQIVAKAMAREDKANAQQKATIDKLAVEFASELNSLGVRVTKLEQNQSNVKLSGNLWVRYNTTDYDNQASGVFGQYRLRLDGTAKVDDKTTFGMRFVTNAPDKNNFANTTWRKFGEDSMTNDSATIDRVFFTTKIGAVDTTLGRQAIKVDTYDVIMDSGAFSFDGAKLAGKAGNVNLVGQYGRFAKDVLYSPTTTYTTTYDGTNYTTTATTTSKFADFQNIDVASLGVASKYGKLDWGLGWVSLKNNQVDKTLATYYLGNVNYTFDKKFSLGAEYVKNNDTDAFEGITGRSGDDHLWAARLVYGDQALKAKGDNNITAYYADVKGNAIFNRFSALPLTAGNDSFDNYKEYWADYNYAFSKNFVATLEYAHLSNDTTDNADINQWRFITNVKF